MTQKLPFPDVSQPDVARIRESRTAAKREALATSGYPWALVSTHLSSPSLGRVKAEERGFGEGELAGACPSELPIDPSPETRKLVSDPPEGG